MEEDALQQPLRVLSREQTQFYFENGYLKLPGFLKGDLLARLRSVTDGFLERSRTVRESGGIFYLEEGHCADNPRLQRLKTPDVQDPVYWEFMADSVAPDIVADVVGPDLKFHHSKLNFKWAKGGQGFNWHQDILGWPHTNYSPVTVGLYLDDCGAEQGPIGMVPRSHLGPLFSEYGENADWTNQIADADVSWRDEDVDYVTGPAGTMFLLNCRTIHGSPRNESDHCRRLLLCTYSAADAFPYTFNPHATTHSGEIIRGRPSLWARHDPRPCMVPPDWSKGFSGPFSYQQAAMATSGTRTESVLEPDVNQS